MTIFNDENSGSSNHEDSGRDTPSDSNGPQRPAKNESPSTVDRAKASVNKQSITDGLAANRGINDLRSADGVKRRAQHSVTGKIVGQKGQLAVNAKETVKDSLKKTDDIKNAEKGRAASKTEKTAGVARDAAKNVTDVAATAAITGATGGAGSVIAPAVSKVTSKIADSKPVRAISEMSTKTMKWMLGIFAGLVTMSAVAFIMVIVIFFTAISGLGAAAAACLEKADETSSGTSVTLGEWDSTKNGLQYNAKYVYLGLRAGGFSPAGAAGAVGNFQAESGVNPWVQQGGPYGYTQKKPPTNPKPCPNVGTGIAQWGWQAGGNANCGGSTRFNALVDWAQAKGKDPWNLQTQVEYVLKEIEQYKSPKGGSLLKYMSEVTDVSDAAYYFHKIYESSGDSRSAIQQNRIEPAKKWYKKFKNLQPESNITPAMSAVKGPVYILGDSLTVGSKKRIQSIYKKAKLKVTINAAVSRSTRQGISALNSSQAKKAKTWVIALGTNDPQSKSAYTKLVNQVTKKAGSRQVVWFTIYRPKHSAQSSTNEAIRTAATNTPNLRVVEFAGAAVNNGHYFQKDKVHLTPTGYTWRGDMYLPKQAVSDASDSGTSTAPTAAGDRWYLPLRNWAPFSSHDVRANTGTPAYAMYYGTVTQSRDIRGCNGGRCSEGYSSYGRVIYIKYKNSGKPPVIYAHLSKRFVQAGDKVVPGQIIGLTGNTGNSSGPHLHLEFEGQGNGGNAPGWITSKTKKVKPPAGQIPDGEGYDTSHEGTPETDGNLGDDQCEDMGSMAPGQTEVGFDDCPALVPRSYVRDGIPAGNINRICTEAVGAASSPEAAKAVIYALNQVGIADYACLKYGPERRYKKGWYDCSSLINRAYKEGANLKKVQIDATPVMNEIDRKYWKRINTKELVPGDIVVYGGRGGWGAAGHVVMYLGNDMIVDTGRCGDKVRVQKLKLPNHGSAFSGAYRMIPDKAR